MSNYYVYVCYVDDVVRYVGQGRGNRWKHCTSGVSSCGQLNKSFHTEAKMEVLKVFEGLSKEESLQYEQECIDGLGLDNLYNKQNPINLTKEMKEYYKQVEMWVKGVYDNLAILGGNINLTNTRGVVNVEGMKMPVNVLNLENFMGKFGYTKIRYKRCIRYIRTEDRCKADIVKDILGLLKRK
jgi:hypothetical protein